MKDRESRGTTLLSHSKPRFDVLGVRVNAVTLQETLTIVQEWIHKNHKDYIALAGTHGIIEAQKDVELKAIYNNSSLTTPDGMPVVWLGRAKGFRNIEKVSGPEIMLETFHASISNGYRHYFYGATDRICDLLEKAMINKFPGLNIVGKYSPPFRQLTDQEEKEIAEVINASRPDIVWVGLGCPKQEHWMARLRPLLTAPVLIGVGAGFDFLSGNKRLAPAFVKTSGFEWLFRLLNEPRRLWPRYSRVIPKFIYLVLREALSAPHKAH